MEQYSNIPAALKQHPNWVTWGIRDAPMKAPFDPNGLLSGRPSPAKAGVRETWGSYHAAVECVRRGLAQGIGYEFDGRVVGVDLDHVLDECGVLLPQAREIVDKLASYTEVSPSGTGLHIFVLAPEAKINRHRRKDFFLEIYSTGRYFTMTGEVYGEHRAIESRAVELQAVHNKYLLHDIPRQNNNRSIPITSTTETADKWRFLHIGLRRDKVLAALWSGERSTSNESANDIAFMNKLAYWCNADPDTMIHAFCSSPYYAQKDEAHQKKCCRLDYLPNTARTACSTVYSTAVVDYERWHQNRGRERACVR